MDSSAVAYTLSANHLPRLSDPSQFWAVIQENASLVIRLPLGSGETVDIFVDYLASEARLSLPYAGTRMATPEGVKIITCLTLHRAKILKSQMAKRGLFDRSDPTDIFVLYDKRFARLPDLCRKTVAFFGSLPEHLTDESDRIIVAIVEESVLSDNRESALLHFAKLGAHLAPRLVGGAPALAIQLRNRDVSDVDLWPLRPLSDELDVIGLEGTQVTDRGLQHLLALPHLDNVDLTNTEITDIGLQILSRIKTLKFIHLSGTRVTSKGVAMLQEALPDSEIVWDEG